MNNIQHTPAAGPRRRDWTRDPRPALHMKVRGLRMCRIDILIPAEMVAIDDERTRYPQPTPRNEEIRRLLDDGLAFRRLMRTNAENKPHAKRLRRPLACGSRCSCFRYQITRLSPSAPQGRTSSIFGRPRPRISVSGFLSQGFLSHAPKAAARRSVLLPLDEDAVGEAHFPCRSSGQGRWAARPPVRSHRPTP